VKCEMMEITNSHAGLGTAYLKARKGSPRFVMFMISHVGPDGNHISLPRMIVELGVSSGQQTEFVEKESRTRGVTQYKILAYDKSHRLNPDETPGQLDILTDRTKNGELSKRVIPTDYDFDEASLPVKSASVDLSYMAHVFHHLTKKERVLDEITRITRRDGTFFI